MPEGSFPDPSAPNFEGDQGPFEDRSDSDSDGPNPFGSPEEPGDSLPSGMSASLALSVARSWVQRHQKEAMIGAFAVGVFAGVLLRE